MKLLRTVRCTLGCWCSPGLVCLHHFAFLHTRYDRDIISAGDLNNILGMWVNDLQRVPNAGSMVRALVVAVAVCCYCCCCRPRRSWSSCCCAVLVSLLCVCFAFGQAMSLGWCLLCDACCVVLVVGSPNSPGRIARHSLIGSTTNTKKRLVVVAKQQLCFVSLLSYLISPKPLHHHRQ